MPVSRAAFIVIGLALLVAVGGVLINAMQSHGGPHRTIAVTVTDGATMAPTQWNAALNDQVTVKITSNVDGQLKLHGYNMTFTAQAGQTTSSTFTTDISGQFQIEWVSPSRILGFLMVT